MSRITRWWQCCRWLSRWWSDDHPDSAALMKQSAARGRCSWSLASRSQHPSICLVSAARLSDVGVLKLSSSCKNSRGPQPDTNYTLCVECGALNWRQFSLMIITNNPARSDCGLTGWRADMGQYSGVTPARPHQWQGVVTGDSHGGHYSFGLWRRVRELGI